MVVDLETLAEAMAENLGAGMASFRNAFNRLQKAELVPITTYSI
jgi:hypothetical protein